MKTKLKGIEKVKEPELVAGFIEQVEKHKIKMPLGMLFKNMGHRALGRAKYNGSLVTININQEFSRMLFTILHELAHVAGCHGHNKKFWRKFIGYCFKMNLDPAKYFDVCCWKRGIAYYEKRRAK